MHSKSSSVVKKSQTPLRKKRKNEGGNGKFSTKLDLDTSKPAKHKEQVNVPQKDFAEKDATEQFFCGKEISYTIAKNEKVEVEYGEISTKLDLDTSKSAKLKDQVNVLQKSSAEKDATEKFFCDKEISEPNAKQEEFDSEDGKFSTKLEHDTSKSAQLKEQADAFQKDFAEKDANGKFF